MLALIALLTLADLPPPRPPMPSCRADRECVISIFDGCCGSCGCGRAPYAVLEKDLKKATERCAIVDCARPNCDTSLKCEMPPPVSSYRAICRAGACQAEPVSTAAECTADPDCAIAYPAPACRAGSCNCCPGTAPVAVPIRKAVTRSEPTPKKDEVKFGLSPAPTPNCAPCPSPRPATAACRAGRCVVAPSRVRPPG